MNRYRVYGGIARVGPGRVLHLSGEQIKARAHNLELPPGYQLVASDPKKEKPPKPVAATVTAKTALEFKVGEIIGLPELLSNLVGIVEPLDPPKTPIDEKAADKALLDNEPKAHAKKTAEGPTAAATAKTGGKK